MTVEGCGAKLSKMLLFLFNFIMLICGAAILGVGTYVFVRQEYYSDLFEQNTLNIVSAIAIGVGCFTFVVSFCGCCGAMKENVCLLKMYFFFILVIILAEIVGGILAFVYSNDIEKSMMNGMTKTIHDSYGVKNGSTQAVDDVQKWAECCGASNYTDYKMAKGLRTGAVPTSCCKNESNPACVTGIKGEPVNTDLIWPEGCVVKSVDTVKKYYWMVGIAALALIVFQIITMVFSCCVIGGITKGYETV